jgi:hypothetical protein
VAAIQPARSSGAGKPGARVGWRLTFSDAPPRILAAPADEPPLGGALFFIDISLGAETAVST